MKYIRVENNQIVGGPRNLPTSWEFISGFNNLSNQELIQLGWYPYEFVKSDDLDDLHITIESIFDILEDKVIEYQQVREKTEYELSIEINSIWNSIKSQRKNLLLECDWTQLPDVQLSESRIQEWRTYRQQLRDITETFQDPRNVIWPTPPPEE